MALDLLTEAPIVSLAEDTKPARLLSRHYDLTRMAELQKHAWSFAIFRAELDEVDTASMPVGDNEIYSHGYELPSDALRVLSLTDTGETSGAEIPWKLEGSLILTNYESPRLVRYIGNLVDPDDWNPLFTEALAAAIARKIALPITGKPQFVQAAKLAYDEAIESARRMNLIESGSIDRPMTWAEERGDTFDRFA
jgi:hypothetical protein